MSNGPIIPGDAGAGETDIAAFDRACALLESALAGDVRRRLVAEWCPSSTPPSRALRRVRDGLASNLRDLGAEYAPLGGLIADDDARTRRDGFHVLHDWDGKAGRVNAQTIAVDVADFAIERRGDEPGHERAAAVLLDYYCLNLLALLSLRAWDEGHPDANLQRLGRLLALLQAEGGSGHRFAGRAVTLLLIATAHYEPNDAGYGALLEKVRTLERRHQLDIAIDHAVAMGCHLRFGFEASYGRDVVRMRDDNVADYPWLHFAVMTLMDAYTAGDEAIAEALINGLCVDPSSFLARPEFRRSFDANRRELVDAFERLRPGETAYSPLAFFFNFSHNVVKGLVVDAVLRAKPWRVSLNDLFTSLPPESGRHGSDAAPSGSGRRIDAATALMEHARRSPDRIRGRPTPAIVYDPATGRHAFAHALRVLKAE